MNKVLNLSDTGGFPFDMQILEFMQDNTTIAISAIASAFGENVILSGVVDTGTNYTDGFIIMNGELLPFVGGLKAARVVVEEVVTQLTFEDTNSKDVKVVRVAKTATTGGVPFTDFIRIKPLADLFTPEKRWDHLMPSGVVMHVKMNQFAVATHFNEAGVGISDTWVGWYIDADSVGRAIFGFDPSDSSFNKPDGSVKGGSKTVSLTEAQLPSHHHDLSSGSTESDTHSHGITSKNIVPSGGGGYNALYTSDGTGSHGDLDTDEDSHAHDLTGNTGDTGGGEAHDNMPPYVVYLNVVKVGL